MAQLLCSERNEMKRENKIALSYGIDGRFIFKLSKNMVILVLLIKLRAHADIKDWFPLLFCFAKFESMKVLCQKYTVLIASYFWNIVLGVQKSWIYLWNGVLWIGRMQ